MTEGETRAVFEAGAYALGGVVTLDMLAWWVGKWLTTPLPRPHFALPVLFLIWTVFAVSVFLTVSAVMHGFASESVFSEWRSWARPFTAVGVLMASLSLQWWRRTL